MTLKKLIFAVLLITMTFTSCQGQKNEPHSQSSNNKGKTMDLTSPDASGQLMKEDDFWKLIDKSRATANNNYQKQISSLKTILLTLDANEIEKFDNTFTAL